MPNRYDWNALDAAMERTLAENGDIDSRTKALSALFMESYLDIDIEEAIDAITDGGNDRGVDALFIDERDGNCDIHLVQTKCLKSFDKAHNNFPASEIDKITTFVSDLLNENKGELSNINPKLSAKVADALDAVKKVKSTVTVHFVGNCAPLVSSEYKRVRTIFSRYSAVRFEMHDLETLADFFLEKEAPRIDREINIVDADFFYRTDQNLRGLVCTVQAIDIINSIRSLGQPEEIDLAIFDQNVRVYLKKNNRINKNIIHSALSDHNHMFWYQNNGITMTCDRYEISPSKRNPSIKLENVQIVNGGQTSNCLFEAYQQDPDKVEDVLLLLRVIETTSEDVKGAVAETTNSQTPINIRDLGANDRIQKQLEINFRHLGYYYERKAKQYADYNDKPKIDALDAAQAFLAYGKGVPEVAKKDRGRVFGDLYETVFSDECTAERLLIAYEVLQHIKARKSVVRKKLSKGEQLARGEMSLIDGAFHALFAVSLILMRDEKDIWDQQAAKGVIDEAINVVCALFADAREKDQNFSSNQFFKDAGTKNKVIARVGLTG